MKERARSEFGLRLRAARERAELTQTQVAKAVGMSQGTYAEAEGTAQGSSYTARIARVCGVSPIWLESGEGQMVEPITWPFKIEPERFLTLDSSDREQVENRLREAIELCELRHITKDEVQKLTVTGSGRHRPNVAPSTRTPSIVEELEAKKNARREARRVPQQRSRRGPGKAA